MNVYTVFRIAEGDIICPLLQTSRLTFYKNTLFFNHEPEND